MADNDDDNRHQSPDNALEPPDDIYNPVRDEEHLAEDNDPPATPAAHTKSGTQLPPDHPEFDYDHDAHEAYDEGTLGATDVDAHEEATDPDAPEPLEPKD
jgi:hypothetical protein